MLKNIDKVLSPKLLKTLCEMGHGDELVIADGNFPSVSMNVNVIRADGLGVEELLRGIMKLFPLDRVVEKNVFLMDVPQGEEKPAIWNKYRSAIEESGEVYCEEYLERYAFYERAKKSFAVVATSEKALYANIIIRKGIC